MWDIQAHEFLLKWECIIRLSYNYIRVFFVWKLLWLLLFVVNMFYEYSIRVKVFLFLPSIIIEFVLSFCLRRIFHSNTRFINIIKIFIEKFLSNIIWNKYKVHIIEMAQKSSFSIIFILFSKKKRIIFTNHCKTFSI